MTAVFIMPIVVIVGSVILIRIFLLFCEFILSFSVFFNPYTLKRKKWLKQHFGKQGAKNWMRNMTLRSKENLDMDAAIAKYGLPHRTPDGYCAGYVPAMRKDDVPIGPAGAYKGIHKQLRLHLDGIGEHADCPYTFEACDRRHGEPTGTDWLAAGYWDPVKGVDGKVVDPWVAFYYEIYDFCLSGNHKFFFPKQWVDAWDIVDQVFEDRYGMDYQEYHRDKEMKISKRDADMHFKVFNSEWDYLVSQKKAEQEKIAKAQEEERMKPEKERQALIADIKRKNELTVRILNAAEVDPQTRLAEAKRHEERFYNIYKYKGIDISPYEMTDNQIRETFFYGNEFFRSIKHFEQMMAEGRIEEIDARPHHEDYITMEMINRAFEIDEYMRKFPSRPKRPEIVEAVQDYIARFQELEVIANKWGWEERGMFQQIKTWAEVHAMYLEF